MIFLFEVDNNTYVSEKAEEISDQYRFLASDDAVHAERDRKPSLVGARVVEVKSLCVAYLALPA